MARRDSAANPALLNANLPLYFEGAQDGASPNSRFMARSRSGIVNIEPNAVSVTMLRVESAEPTRRDEIGAAIRERTVAGATVAWQFQGANPEAKCAGIGQSAGKVNYYIGNDPAKWRTGLPLFQKVELEDLYPGVRLVYYGNERRLEYDFVVEPGASPEVISFKVLGASKVELTSEGELVVHAGIHELRQHKPVIYQVLNGKRQSVEGGFRLEGGTVSFAVGEYDHSLPLVIDPTLQYSTYIGGSGADTGWDIALDGSGNVYIAGETLSPNLPGAIGSYQGGFKGAGGDAFVAKLDPLLSTNLYLTYLGGAGDDAALGIAVDSNGNAYVTGVTDSTNFPTISTNAGSVLPLTNRISGAASTNLHLFPFDAFVVKLNPDGSFGYGTYLGGNGQDQGIGIALDSNLVTYVTGYTESTNFPTRNAFSNSLAGNADAFVTAITNNGVSLDLVYSTYLGGTNVDHGGGIAVMADGTAAVTGWTASHNFPLTFGTALQTNLNGSTNITAVSDAFVSQFSPAGALLYSTLLGGNNTDTGFRLTLDSSGGLYVTGSTSSTNFPVSGVLSNSHSFLATTNSIADVFITKFNPDHTIAYSTVFGGALKDEAWSISVDAAHNAFVTGITASTNFYTTNVLLYTGNASGPRGSTNSGVNDAFVSAVNADASAFLYSSYLGGKFNDFGLGIAVDPAGDAYVAGETASTNFPAATTTFGGTNDAFVSRITLDAAPPLAAIRRGTSLMLRWPGYSPQYSVEATKDFGGAWTVVAPAPPPTNGWHTVTVGITNGQSQFRLRRN